MRISVLSSRHSPDTKGMSGENLEKTKMYCVRAVFFFVSSFICFISFLFILSISLSRSLSIFPEYIRKSLCALCCSVLCCLAVAHTPTTHFHIEKCFFPNRMQTTNRKKVNRIHWNIHEHNNQNIIELKEQKTRLLYIFWQQVH